MTTAQQIYSDIYPRALAAYAQKSPDVESAKQMARAVAQECTAACVALGIAEGAYTVPRAGEAGIGSPGIPAFAPQARPEGQGAAPIVPVGAPQQPAQHYNHVSPGTSLPGGQRLFSSPQDASRVAPQATLPLAPSAASSAASPAASQAQAGIMGTVTQAPNPIGFNALGTNGVIQQPEQRPNGNDTVVAPGNQPMIPAVGGDGTTFVPEKIVR